MGNHAARAGRGVPAHSKQQAARNVSAYVCTYLVWGRVFGEADVAIDTEDLVL